MRYTNKTVIFIALTLLSIVIFNVHKMPTAKAAFISNNIIDDWLFDSAGTMNATQIDTFLNSSRFPSSCISTKNGFTAPDVIGYAPSTGFKYGADVSAGTIIYHAAQVYGLNPQVILTTLEKEEGLVSGGSGCSILRYSAAMGNACPDNVTLHDYSGFELYSLNGVPVMGVTGICVNLSTSVGFSRQVITATWKLKFWEQRSKGNINWAVVIPGWDNSDDLPVCYSFLMTQGSFKRCPSASPAPFDGLATIDNATVHLDNGATAALYVYTPHFHGNQLFVNIFETYFGATTGEGFTLVTSAADNGDLRQWVVYRGVRRYVASADIINAWGLQNTTLIQWPGTYLGSFPQAADLTRLMRPTGTLDVYFVDGGNCYRIKSADMLAAWNFNPSSIQDVSVGLGQVPTNMGNLSYSVKGATSDTIFLVDGGSKHIYANADIQKAWEGTAQNHVVISDGYLQAMGQAADITSTKAIFQGKYYLLNEGRAFVTIDQNIGNAWGITGAIQMNRDISPEFAPYYMLTRFVRSAYPNDLRLFVVDNGVLYALSPEHAVNLGLTPAVPRMAIVPEGITPIISIWSWVMVHDSAGKQYVIDGGTKRPFHPDGQVQGSWTANGTITTPQVTNGFLNLLPNNNNIEREIKGSGLQQYVVEGLAKRWIQSPAKSALYAPLQQVSDSLVSALHDGTNL